jgi:hypothetical protein
MGMVQICFLFLRFMLKRKMNKLIAFLLVLAPITANSQNLQMHYDFAKDRRFCTATLEMFKPDTLGSTFWFVDFDFDFPGSPRSMSSAYWEISRDFYIPGLRKIPAFDQLTFHIEYNDGLGSYKTDSSDFTGSFSYNSIFLSGFSYPLRIGEVVLTTQWLCRIARGMDAPDFQFTLVWFQPLIKGKVLLTGFADLWSQDKIADPDGKELVFQTEPQLWYLLTPKIALGGELEISKNFPAGPNEWEFMPTLGFRWEF